MAQVYDEPRTAVAQRIRQIRAVALADSDEVAALPKAPRDELCRLELLDAIEEATDYEVNPCQAARIADAVLKLLRRASC